MSSFDNPFASGFAEDDEEEDVNTEEIQIETALPSLQEPPVAEEGATAPVPPLPAAVAAEASAAPPLEPVPGVASEAPHGPTFAVVEEEEDAPENGPADEENGDDEDDYMALLLRVADLEATEKLSDLHETTVRMTKKEEQTLTSYIEAQKRLLQKETARQRSGLYSQSRKRGRGEGAAAGSANSACNGIIDAFLENSQWDLVSQHANAHFLFLREADARLQKTNHAVTAHGNVSEEQEQQQGGVAATPTVRNGPLETLMQSVQDMYTELRRVTPDDVSEGSSKKLLQESKQQVTVGNHLLRMAGNMQEVKQRELFQKLCAALLTTASGTEKLLRCREQLRSQLDLIVQRTRPLVPCVQELTAATVQREMEQTVRFIESSYLEQQQLSTNKQLLKQLSDLEAVAALVTLAQTKDISMADLVPHVKGVTDAELDELKKDLEEKEKLYDKLLMEVLFLRKCGNAHDALGMTQTALGPLPTLETSDTLRYSSQQLIEENCELLSELVARLDGVAGATPQAASTAAPAPAPHNEEEEEEKEGETRAEAGRSPPTRAGVPLSAQLLAIQEAIASRQNTLNALLFQNARLWQSMEHTALVARYVYSSDATELVREFFRRHGVATDGLAELLDESFQSRVSDESTDDSSAAHLSLLDIQQQAIDMYQSCIQELHDAAQRALHRVGERYTGPRSRLQREVAFWIKLLNCLDLQEVQRLYPDHPMTTRPFQKIPLHRLTRGHPGEGTADTTADGHADGPASGSLYHFLTVPRTNQSLLAPFKKQTEEMRGTLKALRESVEKKCNAAQEKIDWYAQYTVSEVEQKLEEAKAMRAKLQQQLKEAEVHQKEAASNAQKAQELQETLAQLRLRKEALRAELLRKLDAAFVTASEKEEEARAVIACEESSVWEELVEAHAGALATIKNEAEENAAVKEEEEEEQQEPQQDMPPAAVKAEIETSAMDVKQEPESSTVEEGNESDAHPTSTEAQEPQNPVLNVAKQGEEVIAVKTETEPEAEATDALKREPSPLPTIKEEPQWTPEQQLHADEQRVTCVAAEVPHEPALEAEPMAPPPEELAPQVDGEEEIGAIPPPAEAEDGLIGNAFANEGTSELQTNQPSTVMDEEAASAFEQHESGEAGENGTPEVASPLDEESPVTVPVVNEEEEAQIRSSSAPAPETAAEGLAPAVEEEMHSLEQEVPNDVNVEDAAGGDGAAPLLPQPTSACPVDEEAPVEQQDEELGEGGNQEDACVDVETEDALPVLPTPVDVEENNDNTGIANNTAEADAGEEDEKGPVMEHKVAQETSEDPEKKREAETETPSERNSDYYNPFYNDESFS